MPLFSSRNFADQLEDILDREYSLMAAADFEGLSRLLPQKEDLFDLLEHHEIELNDLRALRDKAERNQRMLDCVKRGVKSAIARLDTSGSVPQALTTYDNSGHKLNFGDKTSTMKRRA